MMLFGKKIKNYLLLAVLGANLFVGASPFVHRDAIWNHKKLPTTFYGRLAKVGLVGSIAGLLAMLAPKKAPFGIAALFISAAATWKLTSGNTVDDWMNDLSKAVENVSTHSLLQQSAFDGNRWQASNSGITDLQLRLKEVGDDLGKLISVVRLLLDCRAGELSKAQKDTLLKVSHDLNALNVVHEQRYAWVLAAADYDTFLEQFTFVSRAPELISQDDFSWMYSASGVRKPFGALVANLKKLKNSIDCMKDVSNKLLGREHERVVRESVLHDVTIKMQQIIEIKKLCDVRLLYASAHYDHERLGEKYSSIVRSGVCAQSPLDDESWMKHGAVFRDLSALACDLRDSKILFEEIIRIGDSLLRQDVSIYFSEQELSDIYAKTEKSREMIKICLQRIKTITGLQLIQNFNAQVVPVLSAAVLREGGSRWMDATSANSWPLDGLLQLLSASRDAITECISAGSQVSLNADVRALKNTYIVELQKTINSLQRALELTNQRILSIKHSAAYAQEVQAKKDYEHALRQEEIRRREEKRRLENERRQREEQQRQDRIRQERERLYQQQQPVPTAPPMQVSSPQALTPAPTAPPMDVPVVCPAVVPTAPSTIDQTVQVVDQPEVGECFCGDGVLPNDAYVLNCSCKNSFYHKDCIRDWIKNKPTCPTCRATVTLADVMKKDFSQPVVVPQSAPVTNPSVQPAVTPVTVVPAAQVVPVAPTLQVDADRECYFCMEVDGDCTTANCDCTVKKAACRECLQEWLDAHHTCPRCQKEGVTLTTL